MLVHKLIRKSGKRIQKFPEMRGISCNRIFLVFKIQNRSQFDQFNCLSIFKRLIVCSFGKQSLFGYCSTGKRML